ncbi:HAD family hydrolase [[Mycoplasma] testudinis]|uniref:HAD family hydrolase n=1 Tax=[Mycoplasma] testudinis TaxID=33924 RepID=UPI0004813006|nr:HAD family hydrolase [[Mycoplasma] testudinis]
MSHNNLQLLDGIICIDSDGCAMDTMNDKHFKYFGPFAVQEWKISNQKQFLMFWNQVNLFSWTRGCNRFIGLYRTFELMHQFDPEVELLDELKKWCETSSSLSNTTLEKSIALNPSNQLQKALHWSYVVNEAIKANDVPALAYRGVKEAFTAIADANIKIAIVSSANKEAVLKEWQHNGLLNYVEHFYTQEQGTKKAAIADLLKTSNLKTDRILMIGDSPGDYEAAEANGVLFYPILCNHEQDSWNTLKNCVLQQFASGEYNSKLAADYFSKFKANLQVM